MKTIAEQVAAFAAAREAKSARMTEIMNKAAEDGTTLDETQREEYDTLSAEIKAVDDHIVRLKAHEVAMKASAVAVTPAAGIDPAAAAAARSGIVTSVKNNLPKGTAFTRYAMALGRSHGNLMQACEIAKQWHDSTPEVEVVLKAAVAAGTTTDAAWAAPLVPYNIMSSEFIEVLRPQTLVGKINGFRRVPFAIKIPRGTSGSSAGWVGEGHPKPVSKMAFDTLTVAPTKIASIIVLTEELVRFSNPSAEALVQSDMVGAISMFMDQQFIDPTVAASSTVSPASVTHGVPLHNSTGATIATVTTDVSTLFNVLIAGNIMPTNGVWVMHPRTALFLSLLRTTQDIFAFPTITMTGGTFFGLPVVTSANVPVDTANKTYITLMDASQVLLADDGGVTLDVSREASLQMSDAPTGGAQSMVSLWQNNLVGLRAEREINWQRRRNAAVAVLSNVAY